MLELESWRRWNTADEEPSEAANGEGGDEADEKPELDPLTERDRTIADLTVALKRLQAEFENYKKRTEREWSDRAKLAGERVITDLLPLLDTFDKALEDARNNWDATSLRKGLESIHKQLVMTLQKEGLHEVEAKHRFDPFAHEAMMREEKEGVEDGRILEVFQKGYALGPKVIRTAKVKVAAKKELPQEVTVQDQPVENVSEGDGKEEQEE
jgi:molecular chaperone GrpE